MRLAALQLTLPVKVIFYFPYFLLGCGFSLLGLVVLPEPKK